MTTFNYKMPVNIKFGPGSSQLAGQVLKEMACRKPLVVTDEGIIAAGVHKAIMRSLEKAGLSYETFSAVRPNPMPDNVTDGVAAYTRAGADCIIALGGGSPMDVAKGIGVILVHGGSIVDFCTGTKAVTHQSPPLITIPTTAGTGSEISPGGVITDPVGKRKLVFGGPGSRPLVALVDPEPTYGIPPRLTALTGLDALSHAIEGYFSKRAQPIVDLYARESIRRVLNDLPIAVADGAHKAARESVTLAALLGGMSMQGGLGIVHCLAHAVGGHTDLPHGLLCGLLIPEVLAHNFPAIEPKMASLAQYLGVATPGADPTRNAQAVIEAIRKLLAAVEITAPDNLEVNETDIDAWTAVGMADKRFQASYTREITATEMKAMLGRIFM